LLQEKAWGTCQRIQLFTDGVRLKFQRPLSFTPCFSKVPQLPRTQTKTVSTVSVLEAVETAET